MKNYKILICYFLFLHAFSCFNSLYAQDISIERVDPPFWWAGMKNNKIQLLVKGNNINNSEVSSRNENVKITKVAFAENPKYVFVDLEIDDSIKPGPAPISFRKNGRKVTYNLDIKKRDTSYFKHRGFSQEDLIYLVMPDRFVNGDTANDIVKGMNDTICDRNTPIARHGGDIKGLMNNLVYIKFIGATAIWLNPVLESNQPFASYHGYAVTDHYKIDPRLGTKEKYRELIQKCHKSDLKVIKDMVFNHIGDKHWFYTDKPFKDWTHENDTFTYSNFRITTLLDPYASKYDSTLLSQGWFDKHMPDLNFSNPYLVKYLIQNAIWWIEYADLNGFRFDTYAYSDLKFMSELAKAIFLEYPDFSMIGEIWDNSVVTQAFFTKDNCNNSIINTHLYGTTDFQLYHAINSMINEEQAWNKGVERIYYTLCNDIAYKNPFNNLIFLDNHDLSRFYSVAGENINKFKMAMGFLLTTRGIPMIYYGTEILMKNIKGPDEKVREDFPGGWEGDKVNKFIRENRSKIENEAFDFVRIVANWRKNNNAVKKGKLMQFVPFDGLYVYFRYLDNEKVMIVINTNNVAKTFKTDRFNEIISGYHKAKNIINKDVVDIKNISVKPLEILILELVK